MKFKKGNKVEVLSRRDVPSGSWRCAEIICGNGHSYTVRYDGWQDVLERISKKAIRPCPPLPEVATNWVSGDVVEVFDDFSWKMATISQILSKNYVLVRLLGSSLEFEVSKFNIRPRQFWQGDKWIVIGKGPVSCNVWTTNTNLTLKRNRNSMKHVQRTSRKIHALVKDDCLPVMCKDKFRESNNASSQTLKRGPYRHSNFEAYGGAAQKFRAVEKGGRLYQVTAAYQSTSPEQVEGATFTREIMDEKFIPSFNNRNGFSELHEERRRRTSAIGCSFAMDLECRDADSATCSVGSCSITSNNSFMLHHHTGFIEGIDGDCSDAESFCPCECEEGNSLQPTKEELAAEIHRLELHAYRCTMEALYACGPLTWEQEALVTNLRLSLHISNDEHLMEDESRKLVYLTYKYEKMALEFAALVLTVGNPLDTL